MQNNGEGQDFEYEEQRFYVDTDNGSIVFQLYTAVRTERSPDDPTEEVQGCQKVVKDRVESLQVNNQPAKIKLNDNTIYDVSVTLTVSFNGNGPLARPGATDCPEPLPPAPAEEAS